MKRLRRPALPAKAVTYLANKQLAVNANPQDADRIWQVARPTKTIEGVVEILRSMFGASARCFFCNDSRACDIDHFAPKATYKTRVFKWTNFLYICAICNRKKGRLFPVDGSGRPTLINPVKTNPWDHIHFDSTTGLLVPKVLVDGSEDVLGRSTLYDVLDCLNFEAIAYNRRLYSLRLQRRVSEFIDRPTPYHRQVIEDEVVGENAFGLATWFFLYAGQFQEPYVSFRAAHPTVFQEMADAVR